MITMRIGNRHFGVLVCAAAMTIATIAVHGDEQTAKPAGNPSGESEAKQTPHGLLAKRMWSPVVARPVAQTQVATAIQPTPPLFGAAGAPVESAAAIWNPTS